MRRLKGHAIRQLRIATLLAVALLPWGCSKKQSVPEQSGHSTPPPVLPRKNYDTARLYSGIDLKSSVDCTQGGMNALTTANESNSYRLDINLHVLWPKAATTPDDITAATPELASLLPNLGSLLQGAKPSPDFATLLANKEKILRANLSSLQRLPYRDSLFDCQTILNLASKPASRQALLVQAVMNVNTDGSDGDRNLTVDKLSETYQPQTNYRWPKSGTRPNPCLREFESRLALVSAELGNGTLTAQDRGRLGKEHEYTKATIDELRRWSFLVGAADPFIVLPSFMVGKAPGQPCIGDYAVVMAHGILYPAIVGDLGPASKIGEASLRVCREIDSRSGADRRPSSRPEIVYLVFPGSAEKPFVAPDYRHWSERCHSLWKEFGGSDNATWHEWTSLEKPWPTTTPTPAPTPIPASVPSIIDQSSGTNPASTTEPTAQPASQPTPPSLPTSSLPSPTENH